MLYLTCTMISTVDLAHYGVSHAKDWVSMDCGTSAISDDSDNMDMSADLSLNCSCTLYKVLLLIT